jgi:hypothetical protein
MSVLAFYVMPVCLTEEIVRHFDTGKFLVVHVLSGTTEQSALIRLQLEQSEGQIFVYNFRF